MGFPHNARKLRDRVRKEYTDETGLSDWAAPEFQRWLAERGELPPDFPPLATMPPRNRAVKAVSVHRVT